MIRIVARGTSASADAYLTPVLEAYIDSFFAGFDPALRANSWAEKSTGGKTTTVEFMRSDGGLTDVRGFSGIRSILSGPAGGCVGFALTSWEKGGRAVIGLDMGGTSTDVSRFDGNYEVRGSALWKMMVQIVRGSDYFFKLTFPFGITRLSLRRRRRESRFNHPNSTSTPSLLVAEVDFSGEAPNSYKIPASETPLTALETLLTAL